jgi:hypothetical protein
MALPIIIFLLTGVSCAVVTIKSQSRLWQIREQLKTHMPHLRKFELLATIKMGEGLENIFNESDTQFVKELKQTYLNELERARVVHLKMVKIFLIGMFITLIVAIIEFAINGKP